MALGVTSLAGVASARADEHACDDARMHVASEVQPRWRIAIDRACAAIAALPGVDPTARVRLAPIDRDLALEVTLADGRFASRRVASPDALLATLEALLVVPPSDRDPKDTRDGRVDRVDRVEHRVDRVDHRADHEEPPPAVTSAWPRLEEGAPARSPNDATPTIEIGGGFGGRVAARGYLSASVAGFADVHVGSWLLGTALRWDLIGSKSAPQVDVFEMETVVVGIVVARRTPVGFGHVDVGISPRLAVETQTFESGNAGESSLSATDVRLGGFGRITFGKSALRPSVELDADLSPSRLRRIVQLDPRLPALPAWSAGVSAGIAWTAP